MGMRARGQVAGMAQISAGLQGGGTTQAAPTGAPLAAPFGIDFTKPSAWVVVIFGASVLYLLGAYVMLGRYRIPL